jgi:predicted nucleic acid-binding protein
VSHLIDTDIVIYHLNDVTAATQLLRQLFRTRPPFSAITFMEVLEGIPMSPDPGRAERRFRALTRRVPLLPVDQAVAERCAQIRQQLRGQGHSLRPRALDLLIAATAVEHGLVLVTNNPHDYRDIPQLSVMPANITP